jgi:predicted enzyme related to lactoylglutathione lyase
MQALALRSHDPEATAMPHHVKLDHAEIASMDPAATQKFMETALGLKFTVTGPEMGNYRTHGPGEGAKGSSVGIRGRMDPNEEPGNFPYFTVPDIDAALKAAKAAGAHVIMQKTEVPKVAWLAVYIAPGEVAKGLGQSLNPP